MLRFKIGDVVRVMKGNIYSKKSAPEGHIGTIKKYYGTNCYFIDNFKVVNRDETLELAEEYLKN